MKCPTPGYGFRVTAQAGFARVGELTTPHGIVDTPTFMPVGTQGSVKTLSPQEVATTGARIVLGNTYHLWLRPGAETVDHFGGLHRFTKWPHVMLTDSGGYQAFSLAERRKRSEDGFTFQSHVDGARKHLSPEEAMRVQGLLGADVAMQLDVCPPGGAPRPEVEEACAVTTRWARRCLAARRSDQAVFGIVQGGSYADLRLRHAAELAELPFDGLALGGFSVGEPAWEMHATLPQVAPYVDPDRPRYLMGVGTPRDLIVGIRSGVDMFDCVLPTRNARNGQALTRTGRVVVKQARYKLDPAPLDEECGCPACAGGFSRAYLRHLFLAGELLAARLLSVHNLHVYAQLTREARDAIRAGSWADFEARWESAGLADNPGVERSSRDMNRRRDE
jgi:queuine tRNA-ribosyltransferase